MGRKAVGQLLYYPLVFTIFYSVIFGNSPLLPAFTVVKSVQNQFSNNREINLKQPLKNVKISLPTFVICNKCSIFAKIFSVPVFFAELRGRVTCL